MYVHRDMYVISVQLISPDSLEKTMMLGKIDGRRRKGQ